MRVQLICRRFVSLGVRGGCFIALTSSLVPENALALNAPGPAIIVTYNRKETGDAAMPGVAHWDSVISARDPDGLRGPGFYSFSGVGPPAIPLGIAANCPTFWVDVIHNTDRVVQVTIPDCEHIPHVGFYRLWVNAVGKTDFTVPKAGATIILVDQTNLTDGAGRTLDGNDFTARATGNSTAFNGTVKKVDGNATSTLSILVDLSAERLRR